MQVINHTIDSCKVGFTIKYVIQINTHRFICAYKNTCKNLDAISANCSYRYMWEHVIKEDNKHSACFSFYFLKKKNRKTVVI